MELDLKKLQIAMARKAMGPGELAKKAGLAKTTVCRYINNSRIPATKQIGLIAMALEVDVTEILACEETKKEQTQ